MTCTGCRPHGSSSSAFSGIQTGDTHHSAWSSQLWPITARKAKVTPTAQRLPLLCPNRGTLLEGPGSSREQETAFLPTGSAPGTSVEAACKAGEAGPVGFSGVHGHSCQNSLRVREGSFPWDPERPGRLPAGGGFAAGPSRGQDWESWRGCWVLQAGRQCGQSPEDSQCPGMELCAVWMLAQTTWPLPYIQDEGCLSLGPSQGFKDAIHITRDTPVMHLLRR